MINRLSTLRSHKKQKLMQAAMEDNPSENQQTKKKKPAKGKSKILRIDSGNFVIGKMSAFDNDYDIIDEIGQGSFGKVYRVKHKALKLERALKKIKKSQPISKFSSFQQIQVLKKLDHGNILKIYEFYETDEFYFIITDIFQGRELFDQIIESEKLTEQIAVRVLQQILKTLNYCHSLGIAHRDIKPENILIKNLKDKNKMKVKIIDWGLGTLLGKKSTNRVCGTPEYAAPEIFKGKYSLQCDMWSLGVLTFIMLTGNMPFKGKGTGDTIRMVQRGIINYRKTGFLDLSPDAKEFVTSLLQKQPSKRLTASQALQHPWIKKHISLKQAPNHLKQTLQRLKQFNLGNRFGVAVINYMNNHYSSTEERDKLDEIFKYLDKNGDGVLSMEELIQGYTQIYGKALGEKIAEETFAKLDVNNSGTLQYSQFVAYGLERHEKDEKVRLQQAFKLFDKDKNGCISWQQISEILVGKIQGLQQDFLKDMIKQLDENGDNEIDFEEFYKFITNIFSKLDQNKKE